MESLELENSKQFVLGEILVSETPLNTVKNFAPASLGQVVRDEDNTNLPIYINKAERDVVQEGAITSITMVEKDQDVGLTVQTFEIFKVDPKNNSIKLELKSGETLIKEVELTKVEGIRDKTEL